MNRAAKATGRRKASKPNPLRPATTRQERRRAFRKALAALPLPNQLSWLTNAITKGVGNNGKLRRFRRRWAHLAALLAPARPPVDKPPRAPRPPWTRYTPPPSPCPVYTGRSGAVRRRMGIRNYTLARQAEAAALAARLAEQRVGARRTKRSGKP